MSRHPGTLNGKRLQKLIAAYKAYGVFEITKEQAEQLKKENRLPTTLDLHRITYAGNISANNSDLRYHGYVVHSVSRGTKDGSRITAFWVASPQTELELA